MLFFILIIATLNLGVGFAVAKSMGRGPRTPSRETILEWILYLCWFACDRLIHFRMPRFKRRVSREEPAAPSPSAAKPRTAPAKSVAASRQAAAAPASAKVPDVVATTTTESIEPAPASPAIEDKTLDEPVSSVVEEASVEDMMAGLMQFRDRIATLDSKVRKCARTPETREVKKCVDEFKQASGEYLATSNKISSQLVQTETEGDSSDELVAKMKQAVEKQASEVRQASQTLEHIDTEGDPEAGCQAMLAQSSSLIASSSQLKDELTETRIEIAKQKGIPIDCQDLLIDDLTQLPSRISLENEIQQHFDGPQASAPLAIALVDMDRLGDLNGEFGAQVGDRLLQGVGQAMQQDLPEGATLGRFEGQRFSMLFPNQVAADVCARVEEMRQQLEAVQFNADSEELSVTASCAVANIEANEDLSAVYSRLEAALTQAKRFGRNRTFMHGGRSPAPVVPPDVSVNARTIKI